EAVYPGGQPVPSNWTLLLSDSIPVDGFFAQAYLDPNGNCIIAYEGVPVTAQNVVAVIAVAPIFLGQSPPALTDAVDFAEQVEAKIQQENLGTLTIYVTGHSVGGTEAEEVAY